MKKIAIFISLVWLLTAGCSKRTNPSINSSTGARDSVVGIYACAVHLDYLISTNSGGPQVFDTIIGGDTLTITSLNTQNSIMKATGNFLNNMSYDINNDTVLKTGTDTFLNSNLCVGNCTETILFYNSGDSAAVEYLTSHSIYSWRKYYYLGHRLH
jgi:hypothetical protein